MAARNLHTAIYQGKGDRPAITVAGGPRLTYAEMERAAAAMAVALSSRGVVRGDRVSFLTEKSPLVVILAHACLRLGAVLHPLNTGYTNTEIEGLLGDAEPRLMISDGSGAVRLAPLATAAKVGFTTLEELCDPVGGKPAPVADVAGNDTAAILYTSGTTGRPKGAMITHENLVESARALGKVWAITSDDRLLHALPVFHAHGLLTAINTMLVAGGEVLFLPRFEPREVIAALPDATVMMGVPTFYARMLKEPDIAHATSNIRVLISGSAPLPLELAEQFRRATGHTIVERYGSTEAAIITAVPPGTIDRTGWVGWPLPGVEVRVLRDDKSHADLGIGILETRGHNVFRGYWRNATADAEAFTESGWFNTGDIAEIDSHGCIRLLGREKDLIISGGLNVYPKEIETVLDTLPGVETSAVFGVPHPDFGEAVVAAVETKAGEELDEPALIAASRERLAAYKCPKRVIAVPEIPRNRMGKVDKKVLRQDWKGLFS